VRVAVRDCFEPSHEVVAVARRGVDPEHLQWEGSVEVAQYLKNIAKENGDN
jgi:hypothetical protein